MNATPLKPARLRSTTPARRRISKVCVLVVAGLIAIGGVWYYAAFVYAHPVSRFDELPSRVDQRVTFRGVFDRSAKAYDLIRFDNHPVRLAHGPRGVDWLPRNGQECRVVGVLRYESNTLWGIPYQLDQPELYPIRTDGTEAAGE